MGVSEAEQCRAVVLACDERFGRLDGLVNAAGLGNGEHVAPAREVAA